MEIINDIQNVANIECTLDVDNVILNIVSINSPQIKYGTTKLNYKDDSGSIFKQLNKVSKVDVQLNMYGKDNEQYYYSVNESLVRTFCV